MIGTGGAALTVNNSVVAGGTLRLVSGSRIRLQSGAVVESPDIALAGQGTIVLTAGAVLGQVGAKVDLTTSSGGIAQDAAATLIAATLSSSAGVTGPVVLSGTANAIGTLTALAVSAGGLTLSTTGDLSIEGAVTATDAMTLLTGGTNRLRATGTISSGSTLTIAAGGGVGFDGGSVAEAPMIALSAQSTVTVATGARIGQSGALIDINVATGGVTQAAGATIVASNLSSTKGIEGGLALVGANVIGALGNIAVTSGEVQVHNTVPLTLTGTISTPENAYLRVSDPGGVTIDPTGGILAGAKGLVTLHAPAITIKAGGTISAGGFEAAPEILGATMTLAGSAGGLNTLIGVNVGLATLGAVTVPGGTPVITAGHIQIDGSFDANNLPLHLLSLGGISAPTGQLANVSTLTGSAAGSVDLSRNANQIGVLAGLVAAGRDADLLLAVSSDLHVAGPVSATRDLILRANHTDGNITTNGTIAAGRTLAISADGLVGAAEGARLTGATIVLEGARSLTFAAGAAVGSADAKVDLSSTAGNVIQDAGATIVAATLTSVKGVAGDTLLIGKANAIGTLAAFAAGGDLRLLNTGGLHVSGPVTSASAIALTVGAMAGLTVGGSIGAGGSLSIASGAAGVALETGAIVTGATIAMTATGPFALGDGTVLGQLGATVDLSTSAGGIAQDARGTLIAGMLRSAGGVVGGASFLGVANTIGTIGPLTIAGAGNSFSLTNHVDTRIVGPLTADGTVTVAIHAGSGLSVAGTVTSGSALSIQTGVGGLDLAGDAFVAAPTILARAQGAISFASGARLGQSGAIVELSTTAGGVDQNAGATIVADVLRAPSGLHGNVSLAGAANAIGVLSDVVVLGGGGFSLRNTGSLSVTGTVRASAIDIRSSAVDVTGGILAETSGVDLLASVGGILQAGTITAATDIAMTGQVGVTHAGSTDASGTVALTAVAGDLFNNGVITAASDVTLRANVGAVTLDGTVTAGSAVTVAATIGAITQSGIVQASTGDFALTTGADFMQTGGTLLASGSIFLTAGGSLTQAAGVIRGTATTGATAITLVANAVTAGSGIVQAAGGSVEAASIGGSLMMTAANGISLAGTVLALDPTKGALSMAANGATASFSLTGRVVAGRSLNMTAAGFIQTRGTMIAGADGIIQTSATDIQMSAGLLQTQGNIDLTAGRSISQSGGMIQGLADGGSTAIRMTASGSAAGDGITQDGGAVIQAANSGGSVSLTAANRIILGGTLLAFDQSLGTIAATANGLGGETVSFTSTGLLNGGFRVLAATTAGAMTQSGTITAGTGGLAMTAATDLTQTAGLLQSSSDVVLTSRRSMTQAGGVMQGSASAGPTAIRLASLGANPGEGFTQAASGTIAAASVGGSVDIVAANAVIIAGAILAPDPAVGRVTLSAGGAGGDTTSLSQGGRISAGVVISQTATAGDITHGGTAIAPAISIVPLAGSFRQIGGVIETTRSPFNLTVPGAFLQDSSARITSIGSMSLRAGTQLRQTGNLQVPGGRVDLFTAGGSLATAGSIVGGQVHMNNPMGPIAVGGAITGLTPARIQNDSQFAVRAADFPTTTEGAGIYVTTGPRSETDSPQSVTFAASVAATTGRGQVLITIPNDAPLSLTMDSPNADLFLSLQTGEANGVLRVGSLHLRYQDAGTLGTVDFAGTVNGLSGYTAASGSFILPAQLSNYMLNGCAIQAASCIQITDLRVPVANPLRDLQVGRTGGQGSLQFALPDVAERDY